MFQYQYGISLGRVCPCPRIDCLIFTLALLIVSIYITNAISLTLLYMSQNIVQFSTLILNCSEISSLRSRLSQLPVHWHLFLVLSFWFFSFLGSFVFERLVFFKGFSKEATDRELHFNDKAPPAW